MSHYSCYRNIEVKISGLSGELSKDITDHLISLFKAAQQAVPFLVAKKEKLDEPTHFKVIKYADVKVQDVTFFLRCSKVG